MKLKDEDIEEITILVDEGYRYRRLAPKFQISNLVMQRIIARYKSMD